MFIKIDFEIIIFKVYIIYIISKMDNNINYLKCMSVKNKHDKNIQCPYNKKNNSEYCGIHCRSKSVTRIDNIIKVIILPDNNKKILYTNSDMLINYTKIRKEYIINSLYHFGLLESKKIKKSKRNLYISLFNYLKGIEEYIFKKEIITIQKYYRRYSIYSRSKSINDCNLLTLETIYLLPVKYLYRLKCKNGKLFCFDIRYLNQLFQNDESPINPYTLIKFNDKERSDISKRIHSISNISIDKIDISSDNKLELKIISVFKKFNDLDNYTDPDWFFNLTFKKLKSLYLIAEDVWNYRAQLSESKKIKILNNTKVFIVTVESIKKMNIEKDFKYLREIIINIFNRFVTEGINRDEKKLGAMLMLTAMVEVSIDAANAMPYLIQVS